MTISADNINFVLSGGTNNVDPNESIGGDPSLFFIPSGVVNNLFDDITPQQSEDGYTDYRLFYVTNDGLDPIYNPNIWIDSQVSNGATVEIGFIPTNEGQRIQIVGQITGGFVDYSIDGFQFRVETPVSIDSSEWAINFQNALRAIIDTSFLQVFQDVTVSGVGAFDLFVFDINFVGRDGLKNYGGISVVNNNLTTNTTNQIIITTIQNGSPINALIPELDSEISPPGGVTFFNATEATPLTLPILRSNDFFGVWIKRTVEAGANPVVNDGFTLIVRAEGVS